MLIRRDVVFNEELLYDSHVEQPSSDNLLPLAISLPHSVDDFASSSSSSSSEFLSPPHPSEPTPTQFPEFDPPRTSDLSSSSFLEPLVPVSVEPIPCSPLTPQTLLSHPNYQPATPIRLRSLTDIASPVLPPSSLLLLFLHSLKLT